MDEQIEEVINKQYSLIGEKVLYKDVAEGIMVKGKKVAWYDYYYFESEQQYLEWKEWAKEKLEEVGIKERFDEIDMLYGLNIKIKKEGQLF